MGAALWSWFLVGSEGNVRQWSLLARRRFRPSVPWCFAVSESPARTLLWNRFEGMGAALWSWFLVGSEGNVRQWSLLARRHFRPSVSWCFAVSESPARTSLWSCFEGMGAALWSWFPVGSEGNVRQWSLLARRRFCPSVPWCYAVSESPARTSLWSCFDGMGAAVWSWLLVGLKATLGSGACLLGAASVLQCHGVLLFRNRSLELRCGAVLTAWELHFGAGFLSVQKLGTGACLLGAASARQCHGVLLQRQTETDRVRQSQTETDRQLGRQPGRQADKQAGREAGKEAGRQTDRQAGREAGRQTDRQAGRQTDRQPSARSSFRSCFEGVGAALWSWFLVGSERDVRHWGPLPAGALRPSGPMCSAMVFCCFGIAR